MAAWPRGRSEIARDAHACARFPNGRTVVRPFGDRARCACMCSLSQWPDGGPAIRRSREMRMQVLAFPMAGRWSGHSEIARDAHACARFPNGRTVVRPFGSPAGMHVLAFRVVSLLRHNSEIG